MPSKPSRSELRKDYLMDRYVVIAPKRSDRPQAVDCPECREAMPSSSCPFCPRNTDKEMELLTVGPKKSWRIKVLANKFPAVTRDNPKAYGLQEVVVETPDHDLLFEDLPETAIAELFEVFAKRSHAAAADRRIKYVIFFRNTSRAGASVPHAHSQIFALDLVPPDVQEELRKVAERRRERGSCPYCDIIGKEMKGARRVYADDRVAAFAPYASRYNHELWIMPRRHVSSVTGLDAEERRSLAVVLKKAAGVVARELRLPYNFYCHDVIGDDGLHFCVRLTPRGSVWAGLELGSGVIVNPIPPEEAAARYRKAFGTR